MSSWLVSEILRGGYGQAVVDKAQVQKQEREKIHRLRVSQREEDEMARERSSQRVVQRLKFLSLWLLNSNRSCG